MEIKYKERQWEGGEQIEREGEEINGFFFLGGGGWGLWEELCNLRNLKDTLESKIISASLNPKMKRHCCSVLCKYRYKYRCRLIYVAI